jgi:hypothetical protein
VDQGHQRLIKGSIFILFFSLFLSPNRTDLMSLREREREKEEEGKLRERDFVFILCVI